METCSTVSESTSSMSVRYGYEFAVAGRVRRCWWSTVTRARTRPGGAWPLAWPKSGLASCAPTYAAMASPRFRLIGPTILRPASGLWPTISSP